MVIVPKITRTPGPYKRRARAFVRANVSLRALYSTSLATRIPALSQSRPFTQYPISKLRYPSQIELLVHTFIGRRINQNKQTISMIRWNAKNADRKLKGGWQIHTLIPCHKPLAPLDLPLSF